jgi:hypothetical protein
MLVSGAAAFLNPRKALTTKLLEDSVVIGNTFVCHVARLSGEDVLAKTHAKEWM